MEMALSDEELRDLFVRHSNGELLALWASVMAELNERGVIRSDNNPIGDYCEFLVAAHYEVEPEAGSTKGFDVRTPDGTRLQVKGRRLRPDGKMPPIYSAIRNLDPDGEAPFDFVIALHLNRNFTVHEAWQISLDAVRRHASYRQHTNSWALKTVRSTMLDDPGITKFELRHAP
jgi:hypothetical protein